MPFSIGFGELVVIGVVALIVIGPKDLPQLFRSVGHFTGRMRAMADDFRRTMEAAADDAGVNDLKKQYRDISSMTEEEMGFADTNETLRELNKTKLNNIQNSAAELEAETEIEDSDEVIAKAKKPKTAKPAKKIATKSVAAKKKSAKTATKSAPKSTAKKPKTTKTT